MPPSVRLEPPSRSARSRLLVKHPSRLSLFLSALVAGGALLLSALPAGAQVLAYGNFTGGSGYDYNSGQIISGPDATPYVTRGYRFTSAANGRRESLEAGLMYQGPGSGPNAVTMTLYADNAGTLGPVLESWTLTDLPTFGYPAPARTFSSVLHPTLVAGESYFLVGSATGDTSACWGRIWNMGESVFSVDGAAYQYASNQWMGAYRVELSSVPEPATSALLLGLAGIGIIAVRRRLRR